MMSSKKYYEYFQFQAVMEVNENGVEASAVTGIELVTLKGGVPEMYFFLDRPFAFFIIEKTTQMVDFAGIVQTPLE